MSNMRLVMRQAFRNMDSFLDFIFCNIIRRIDNPGATSEVVLIRFYKIITRQSGQYQIL